jgi:tetraacyldisaccharide 4'-kinase
VRNRVQQVAPQSHWLELAHQPTGFINCRGEPAPLESLVGKRIAAFCGIGNPAGFRHTLSSCGLDVARLKGLPDHCPYSSAEVMRLERWIEGLGDVAAVVCTGKDLVKLLRDTLAGRPLVALEISLQITMGHEQLEQLLQPLVEKAVQIDSV